jgi:hypothetical protein
MTLIISIDTSMIFMQVCRANISYLLMNATSKDISEPFHNHSELTESYSIFLLETSALQIYFLISVYNYHLSDSRKLSKVIVGNN